MRDQTELDRPFVRRHLQAAIEQVGGPPPAGAAPHKRFYEKVINVKADVAALLLFDLRHISTGRAAGAVASRTAEDTETRHTRKAVALACLFMVAPVERIVTV